MAEINNLNGLNSANSGSAVQNTQPTSTSTQAKETISLTTKKTKEEWLAILIANGFTEAQVEAFLTKNPNFFDLPTAQQSEAVKTYIADKAKASTATKDVDKVDSTETVNTVETPQAKKITVSDEVAQNVENNSSVQTTDTQEEAPEIKEFDPKEYNKMSLEDKQKAVSEEMLKNLFMYGDPNNQKTEEDWARLSQEAKAAYIEKVKNSEAYKKIEKLLNGMTEQGLSNELDRAMTKIQVANHQVISIVEFENSPVESRDEAIYDYLNVTIELYGEEALSNTEKDYWNEKHLLAESLNFYYKKQGETTNVCPGDVSNHIKNINKNAKTPEEKVHVQKLQYEYLKNKKESGVQMSEYEKEELKVLENLINSKSMDSLLQMAQDENYKPQNSIYTQLREHVDFDLRDAEATVSRLDDFVQKQYKKGSVEHAEELMKCALDAANNQDRKLAAKLLKLATASNPEAVCEFLKKNPNANAVAVVAANIESVKPENAGMIAEAIDNLENAELSQYGGLAVQELSTEEQRVSIAEAQIDSKNEKVKNGVVENLRNGSEKTENQRKIDALILNSGDLNLQELAVSTTGLLNDDYELESLRAYQEIGNPRLIKASANIISQLAEMNQVEAFNMTRISAGKLSDDDAKNIDLTLADQIAKCKNKDNQLAMHKEIMTSKFEEVQVKAASNIKDYDASVQLEAIDEVYASGNKEAVNIVYNNIASYQPTIQKEIIEKSMTLSVMDTESQAANFEAKLFSGSLTAREIAQLSPRQKQRYFIGLFVKATPAQKLQMMQNFVTSNMIGAIQKKVIYTMIARSSYLKDMVESGMGKTMLEAGLPVDATNKIVNAMKISTNGTVINQRKELAKDSGYKKYFESDIKLETKEVNNSNRYATFGLKDTFTPTFVDAKTRAELAKNKSTMFIKS